MMPTGFEPAKSRSFVHCSTKIIPILIWTKTEHFVQKSRNPLDGPVLKSKIFLKFQLLQLYTRNPRGAIVSTVDCGSIPGGSSPFYTKSLKNVNIQKWNIYVNKLPNLLKWEVHNRVHRTLTELLRQFVEMESLKFGQNSKEKQIMMTVGFEPETQDHQLASQLRRQIEKM